MTFWPLDANVRSQLGYVGRCAAIVAVVDGSPADRAGLPPGDLIQSVNGKAVDSPANVSAIVSALARGGPYGTSRKSCWTVTPRSSVRCVYQLVAISSGTMSNGSPNGSLSDRTTLLERGSGENSSGAMR